MSPPHLAHIWESTVLLTFGFISVVMHIPLHACARQVGAPGIMGWLLRTNLAGTLIGSGYVAVDGVGWVLGE